MQVWTSSLERVVAKWCVSVGACRCGCLYDCFAARWCEGEHVCVYVWVCVCCSIRAYASTEWCISVGVRGFVEPFWAMLRRVCA